MMNLILKSMNYKYIVLAETEESLSPEVQMEILEHIRNGLRGMKNSYHDLNFTVLRDVRVQDIAEAMGMTTANTDPIITDSQDWRDCKFYDEAQGRNKCCNSLLKTKTCYGVCKFWEHKIIQIKK